jgi:phosphoribosyl-AMP cyclohydrolase / phosphoribosyl-ATP pyrophosphohydrolase
MAYFPKDLYEILKERAGDNRAEGSKTKQLLEQGGPAIVSSLVREAGEVAGAAMEQDLDGIVNQVADLWYHSLVMLLYFGIEPDQVERRLIDRGQKKP